MLALIFSSRREFLSIVWSIESLRESFKTNGLETESLILIDILQKIIKNPMTNLITHWKNDRQRAKGNIMILYLFKIYYQHDISINYSTFKFCWKIIIKEAFSNQSEEEI
jgi:ribosome-associated toxin RatA of RatAB toxin-antitoxin module